MLRCLYCLETIEELSGFYQDMWKCDNKVCPCALLYYKGKDIVINQYLFPNVVGIGHFDLRVPVSLKKLYIYTNEDKQYLAINKSKASKEYTEFYWSLK